MTDQTALAERVRRTLRPIPDYPKPGIVFQDITPVLGDGDLLRAVVAGMADPFRDQGITHVYVGQGQGRIAGIPSTKTAFIDPIVLRQRFLLRFMSALADPLWQSGCVTSGASRLVSRPARSPSGLVAT